MIKVIGLGCIARVGKDSSYRILKKYIPNLRRRAFADELKLELSDLISKNYGIDVFTDNEQEKNVIRPLLVAFGQTMRALDYRCWIKRLKVKIDQDIQEGMIPCVTDVRFQKRDGDECDFIQKEMGGLLVNIDRIMPDGTWVKPANETEDENYLICKALANVNIVARDLTELEDKLVAMVVPKIYD